MKYTLAIFSVFHALGVLVSRVCSYTNPLSCSGTCNNAHDPSIIQRDSDGTYFRFSTGGRIAVYTAPSISGPWSSAGSMLANCSIIQQTGNCDLWAPDVHKVRNKYYVYYSVSSFGSQDSALGLASSPSMNSGTWTDHGSIGVKSSKSTPYNAIDPNLIQIRNVSYLNFGSFWKDIYQVQMTEDPRTTAVDNTASQLAYASSSDHAAEGSYMILREGYYYLFYSAGSCCGYDKKRPASGKEYKIVVCRSSIATGGFVDKEGKLCTAGGGSVVLESHDNVYGPGGQSLYEDLTNGWIMVYHYVNTSIGYADGQKQFGWNQINWTGGWPTI